VHIPEELKYACSFWAHHLCDTGLDNAILVELKDLMDIQFPYWLEVLSLLNQVPTAIESLEITCHCVLVSAIDVWLFFLFFFHWFSQLLLF
jgi:hypothetical protein